MEDGEVGFSESQDLVEEQGGLDGVLGERHGELERTEGLGEGSCAPRDELLRHLEFDFERESILHALTECRPELVSFLERALHESDELLFETQEERVSKVRVVGIESEFEVVE